MTLQSLLGIMSAVDIKVQHEQVAFIQHAASTHEYCCSMIIRQYSGTDRVAVSYLGVSRHWTQYRVLSSLRRARGVACYCEYLIVQS